MACAAGLVMEWYNLYYNNKHDNQQNAPSLRGRSRREMHEQMRQQMMARANNTSATTNASAAATTTTSTSGTNAGASESNTATSPSISQRLQRLVFRISQSIMNMAFHHEGPHQVTDTNGGGNTESGRPSAYSMASWLVRLHLAQYLITGKYPTVLHRLLGLKISNENDSNSTPSTIPLRPNSQKVMALLILIQASSTAVRNTTNWMARLVATYMEQRRRKRSASLEKNRLSPEAELQTSLAGFFGDGSISVKIDEGGSCSDDESEEEAGVDSSGRSAINAGNIDGSNNGSKVVITLCSICRTQRKHPAAPVSCGHVCCWTCLNQWVINVRPECPLCRAPCKPQEIIPLYHYEPVAENDGSEVVS